MIWIGVHKLHIAGGGQMRCEVERRPFRRERTTWCPIEMMEFAVNRGRIGCNLVQSTN
jgi:hypothetical protein